MRITEGSSSGDWELCCLSAKCLYVSSPAHTGEFHHDQPSPLKNLKTKAKNENHINVEQLDKKRLAIFLLEKCQMNPHVTKFDKKLRGAIETAFEKVLADLKKNKLILLDEMDLQCRIFEKLMPFIRSNPDLRILNNSKTERGKGNPKFDMVIFRKEAEQTFKPDHFVKGIRIDAPECLIELKAWHGQNYNEKHKQAINDFERLKKVKPCRLRCFIAFDFNQKTISSNKKPLNDELKKKGKGVRVFYFNIHN
jgi:hypothetical protein